MHINTTGIIVFSVVLLSILSIVGGHFMIGTVNIVGGDMPSSVWEAVGDGAQFYWDMMTVSEHTNVPIVINGLFWMLSAMILWCLVVLIRGGGG